MGAASLGAIEAGQAFVELLADSSRLEKGLRAAPAKLRAWGTSISSFGRKMAGIGLAIAGPLAGTGKVFGDFEQQMKMVSTMLDEPEKHMDRFLAGIRKLSVEFGEGTDVLAKGLYDLLSASVDPAQALGVLETAVKAAKGRMTDTPVAVDGLTSVLCPTSHARPRPRCPPLTAAPAAPTDKGRRPGGPDADGDTVGTSGKDQA